MRRASRSSPAPFCARTAARRSRTSTGRSSSTASREATVAALRTCSESSRYEAVASMRSSSAAPPPAGSPTDVPASVSACRHRRARPAGPGEWTWTGTGLSPAHRGSQLFFPYATSGAPPTAAHRPPAAGPARGVRGRALRAARGRSRRCPAGPRPPTSVRLPPLREGRRAPRCRPPGDGALRRAAPRPPAGRGRRPGRADAPDRCPCPAPPRPAGPPVRCPPRYRGLRRGRPRGPGRAAFRRSRRRRADTR